jgi:hypothetical protein
MFGDYYDRKGKWLGNDGIDDDKVYVATGKTVKENADGTTTTTFDNAVNLGITHTEFATMANVVKHESSGNQNESLWIAHAANNAKDNNAIDWRRKNTTLYDQLTDPNYSTTPATARTPLNASVNTLSANAARASIIDVMTGGTDPTGGAVLWDGTDFLTKGITHNKFKEYTSISIPNTILQSYTIANEKYSPAPIFTETLQGTSDFFSTGNSKRWYYLISTGTQGRSIFWKLGK